jgi:hypothetical protein
VAAESVSAGAAVPAEEGSDAARRASPVSIAFTHVEVPQLTPIILMVSVHPSRAKDLLTSSKILASPDLSMRDFQDTFGNICTRVTAPPVLSNFPAPSTFATQGVLMKSP